MIISEDMKVLVFVLHGQACYDGFGFEPCIVSIWKEWNMLFISIFLLVWSTVLNRFRSSELNWHPDGAIHGEGEARCIQLVIVCSLTARPL